MSEHPVPGGRPPRRGEGTTSAWSHPELVSGDLAIAPRRHVSIMAMSRSVASTGARERGTLATLAIVMLVSTIVFRERCHLGRGDAKKQKSARTCMQWHLAAGAVVGGWCKARATPIWCKSTIQSLDAARRRNCEAGWVTLACQDYHAVVAGAPGYAMTNQLFPCARYATLLARPGLKRRFPGNQRGLGAGRAQPPTRAAIGSQALPGFGPFLP